MPTSHILLVVALLLGGCGLPDSVQRTAETPAPTVAPSKTAVPPKAVTPPKATAPPKAAAPAKAVTPTPIIARPPTPTLDLKSLEQRIKDTGAVGVLTKLSLKNQVDDLVARFRAFHAGQRPPTLGELRPSFDLLLMKVLSLLQDKDAGLAKDIDASRNAIWEVLTDRDKLAKAT